MERRDGERFKVGERYRAKLILASEVKIKDISASGVCLETALRLNTNTVYRIELVSAGSERITPRGEVVRSLLKGTTHLNKQTVPLYEVGISFVSLDADEKDFLGKLMTELAEKPSES